MKMRLTSARAVLLALFATFGMADRASAITLRTALQAIYQVSSGSGVRVGHTVMASTDFNRLIAGGSFVAACADPHMMPVTGSRGLSSENLLGGLQLYVTIPATLPATVNMPGFFGLPRGTIVACTYNWMSQATEGGYSVGVTGITFQAGNGMRSEGGTEIFHMHVPSGTDPNENSSCIP